MGTGDDNSTMIIIVICVVLALLLLGVIAFMITRTSVYKKFKLRHGAAGQPLMLKNSYEKNDGIHFVPDQRFDQMNGRQPSRKNGRNGKHFQNFDVKTTLANYSFNRYQQLHFLYFQDVTLKKFMQRPNLHWVEAKLLLLSVAVHHNTPNIM